MDDIVLATPEEVEKIRAVSDLDRNCFVYKMGQDTAVVRNAWEIDPYIPGENSNMKRKLMFAWGLGNMLRANGIPAYYFNSLVADETWQKSLDTFGATRTSTGPEYRYKKVL